MAENIYSKGTQVWFPDKEQGWMSAEVVQVVKSDNDAIKLVFVDDRGKVTLLLRPCFGLYRAHRYPRKSRLRRPVRMSRTGRETCHLYATLRYSKLQTT